MKSGFNKKKQSSVTLQNILNSSEMIQNNQYSELHQLCQRINLENKSYYYL